MVKSGQVLLRSAHDYERENKRREFYDSAKLMSGVSSLNTD